MIVQDTKLSGVKIILPKVFSDSRGFFKESFNKKRYEEALGLTLDFVQDNYSRSSQGVLRGLHFQKNFPQGKLVSVTHGEVLDVVADINPKSSTYGQYVAVTLSATEHNQLWVPPGYAHGFYVLSERADFFYKCTDYYNPQDEGGVAWNCPDLAIDWPTQTPELSEKDKLHPTLKELASSF